MDIVILAVLTAYIFYRLSKNLGKINEEEKNEIHKKLLERKKQIEEILMRAQSSSNPNVYDNSKSATKIGLEKIVGSKSTDDKKLAHLDSATQENLSKIFSSCNIDYDFFMNGAKTAFEMIINAFANENIETLNMLLSDKIFQGFESSINERRASQQKLTTNLIAIDNVEIMSAMLIDKVASIVVKITSRQINYISDKEGNIVQGKKDEIFNITDIWTLKRDITSDNPNWKVSATSN